MFNNIIIKLVALGVCLLCFSPAHAEYDEYCYKVALKLAKNPSTLKMGEMDGLKTCLQDLQRSGVVKQVKLGGIKELECPKPNLKKLCAVCKKPKPNLNALCPAWLEKKEEKERKERADRREKNSDRKRLKPHIPGY